MEVQPYLKAIEEGAPLALDLTLSRRLLQTLNENPAALTHAGVRRFLRADEAVEQDPDGLADTASGCAPTSWVRHLARTATAKTVVIDYLPDLPVCSRGCCGAAACG
jgi:hypothetical protein